MKATKKRRVYATVTASLIAAALLLWLFWPLRFSDMYSVTNGVSLSYTHYKTDGGSEHYEAVLAPGSPGLDALGELLGSMEYHRTLLTPFSQAHPDIGGEHQLVIFVAEHGGNTAGIELTDGSLLSIDDRKYDMGLFSNAPERELVEAVIDAVDWAPVVHSVS